jgi:hypothetical protein
MLLSYNDRPTTDVAGETPQTDLGGHSRGIEILRGIISPARNHVPHTLLHRKVRTACRIQNIALRTRPACSCFFDTNRATLGRISRIETSEARYLLQSFLHEWT